MDIKRSSAEVFQATRRFLAVSSTLTVCFIALFCTIMDRAVPEGVALLIGGVSTATISAYTITKDRERAREAQVECQKNKDSQSGYPL